MLFFQVVEDVRLQTVSVAPPMPKRVPEGDLKKINAMSWLLDHPDTEAEAAVQVNGAFKPKPIILIRVFSIACFLVLSLESLYCVHEVPVTENWKIRTL